MRVFFFFWIGWKTLIVATAAVFANPSSHTALSLSPPLSTLPWVLGTRDTYSHAIQGSESSYFGCRSPLNFFVSTFVIVFSATSYLCLCLCLSLICSGL